ncbi:metallopeptidase family protein [Rhodococcus sp. BP-252]|uniref:Metallopeptidase family protein n=1 Tax=Rhodococcoides kyotonense TaxID=398843 RepID=A0A177Y908_9NOCA|nr:MULTISPECIES: metallopeptidase family protein [Rhodococcus]MBY6411775.1 metallopeptidase family protein [Rhodococcus sp. BP-320]MBY6419813.1 metallopeptidase family protein [Rhodococcus sp. BP-321]MBY6424772.1 metallopeptidase family protein [Rhodococcus sp. BP-324]MBY6429755.1 metallopeptidase family protein [Rhodococcus sp. BP-323]MBY6434708.1 metallopeptidase family protein [Rhodococcus sp. BP-322]
MSDADFDNVVSDALDTLPPAIIDFMDNVVVLVEDEHPTEDILGLYEGIALTERFEYSGHLPDVITIYRRPILEMVDDADTARREIAITVAHEVGHHFGIDDERLHELGFG